MISKRWAIVLVGALHVIVFAGPILLSTDVFSYIAYARMGVEHGINPYLHGPIAIVERPGLPVRRAGLEARRHRLRPAVHAALLSARAARRDGRAVGDEARGAARERRHARAHLALRARARAGPGARRCCVVGANPLYIIYGLGGAHNDLIMLLLMMAAVSLTLAGGTPRRPPRSSRARS